LSSFIPATIWLFLYPAVLLSAWISDLTGGIVAAITAANLGIYVFIPPHFTWELSDSRHYLSVGIFITMGVLFGLIFEKLKRDLHLVQSLADSQTQSDQVRLALALGTSHAG
jgi:K+-sensing histidine kinase KdpD